MGRYYGKMRTTLLWEDEDNLVPKSGPINKLSKMIAKCVSERVIVIIYMIYIVIIYTIIEHRTPQ